MPIAENDRELYLSWRNDWNKFIRDVLGIRLDRQQRQIIRALQSNRRVSVRSGHARGKDYTAAVASLCFLYLNYPCKVINTAPTRRQVISIMMTEIARIHSRARIPLGGTVTATRIKFDGEPDWFLEGFKAGDKAVEAWTGYHSPNIMVVVTEASGLAQETFDAIEGLLTGNSRLLLIFNPVRTAGEAYNSVKSPHYAKFKLSSLDAVNVRAKRVLIPGQVDEPWVAEKIEKWCRVIDKGERDAAQMDFMFRGRCYRPNDLFRVKVLGQFPKEADSQLVPLAWIEAARQRWEMLDREETRKSYLRLGVDVAGMGRDSSCFAWRFGSVIDDVKTFAKTDHMRIAGLIKNELRVDEDNAFIDTIGEGAGVFSRLMEQGVNVVSVKGSESAAGLTDASGEREFANMRAYLHWALRDALNPALDTGLALPPDDLLTQEICEPQFYVLSNGKIFIEPKEKIIARLGRSPDRLDAVLNTFYPRSGSDWNKTSWIGEGR